MLLYQYLPILQKQHIINPHLAVSPQVAHHIPMQCRLVNPARLRITIAQGQVHRTTYLLIEERIPGTAIHARIQIG